MKTLKGTVVLAAALGLMALVGAGMAPATTLCSTNTSPCTGTTYGSGTTITAQLKAGTTAVLTNSISNWACKKSTLHLTTTSAGGAGAAVSATAPIETGLTFRECANSFGQSCSVTVVRLPYSGIITSTGKGNGTLTVQSDGRGSPGWTMVCGSLINCTFTAASATLAFTGGNPGIAAANGIALEPSGGFCPSSASWDAEYEVTVPKPLFAVL